MSLKYKSSHRGSKLYKELAKAAWSEYALPRLEGFTLSDDCMIFFPWELCGRALVEGFGGELPVPGGGHRTVSMARDNVASGSGFPTEAMVRASIQKQRG